MLRQYEAADLAPLAEDLHRENQRANWISLLGALAFSALVLLLGYAFFGKTFSLGGFMGMGAVRCANALRGNKRRRQAFTKANHALSQAMDRSTLGPLLQMRSACQSSSLPEAQRLSGTCDTFLRRRLPRATEDELEQLSTEERKILARLLSQSLGGPLTKPAFQPNQEPSLDEAELATPILLALTSLKQPGGEKSARRILRHFRNEALREAAQDYLKAEKKI